MSPISHTTLPSRNTPPSRTPPEFIPTTPWQEPEWTPESRNFPGPLPDGTIPGNLVRLNMEYRGRLLGLQDSDFVAISHENTDTATQGKRGTFLVLDDLLTTAEIAQLLAEASAQRFGQPHNKHGEFIDDASLRNDVAVTIRWESVAQLLWPRIQSFLPDHSLRRFGRRGSLNPRLRFSKYGPGGKFRCHYDSPFIDPDDPHNVSQYTLLVYLTEVAEGGETRFVDAEHTPPLVLDVKPKAGRAVVFDYNVMHCGREVVAGEKVVMKADVMVENTRAKLPPGALD